MELLVSAEGIEGGRGASLEQLLALTPSLAGSAFLSADVGFKRVRRRILALLRLSAETVTPAIQDRLTFWFAREGASVRRFAEMTPREMAAFRSDLASCDTLLRGVSPERFAAAVRRMGVAAGVTTPPAALPHPVLKLHVGGPEWDAFTYDRGARTLHVPTPLSPPLGDELMVQLSIPGEGRIASVGPVRVTAARSRDQALPGFPAGFSVALGEACETAHLVLAARCAPAGGGARRAPRHRVGGPVDLGPDAGRGFLRNLSTGGAFLQTSNPRELGSSVDVCLRLPGGRDLVTPATVVHSSHCGTGVSFTLDAEAEAALSTVLTSIPGRARRVLVVEDDALARQMLSDAFESRGFEVVTAPNGVEALRAIIDELFSLDAVVSDVCMPEMSGEDLVRAVRSAGGETDLPIIVVSATCDDSRRERLAATGADAVLSKSGGPEAVVQAVEATLEARHSAAQGADARRGAPAVPAAAAGA